MLEIRRVFRNRKLTAVEATEYAEVEKNAEADIADAVGRSIRLSLGESHKSSDADTKAATKAGVDAK